MPPNSYAVQPLGQTAGLKWKLSLPAFHPEGWQAAKRESAGPDARMGTMMELQDV